MDYLVIVGGFLAVSSALSLILFIELLVGAYLDCNPNITCDLTSYLVGSTWIVRLWLPISFLSIASVVLIAMKKRMAIYLAYVALFAIAASTLYDFFANEIYEWMVEPYTIFQLCSIPVASVLYLFQREQRKFG